MKEMNIQFHKTRPQNPFDDGAKARLHRMGLLRIDGSVDEATLNALSRAYSGLLFDDLCDTCQNSCEITEILRRVRSGKAPDVRQDHEQVVIFRKRLGS